VSVVTGARAAGRATSDRLIERMRSLKCDTTSPPRRPRSACRGFLAGAPQSTTRASRARGAVPRPAPQNPRESKLLRTKTERATMKPTERRATRDAEHARNRGLVSPRAVVRDGAHERGALDSRCDERDRGSTAPIGPRHRRMSAHRAGRAMSVSRTRVRVRPARTRGTPASKEEQRPELNEFGT